MASMSDKYKHSIKVDSQILHSYIMPLRCYFASLLYVLPFFTIRIDCNTLNFSNDVKISTSVDSPSFPV